MLESSFGNFGNITAGEADRARRAARRAGGGGRARGADGGVEIELWRWEGAVGTVEEWAGSERARGQRQSGHVHQAKLAW